MAEDTHEVRKLKEVCATQRGHITTMQHLIDELRDKLIEQGEPTLLHTPAKEENYGG